METELFEEIRDQVLSTEGVSDALGTLPAGGPALRDSLTEHLKSLWSKAVGDCRDEFDRYQVARDVFEKSLAQHRDPDEEAAADRRIKRRADVHKAIGESSAKIERLLARQEEVK